MKRIELQPFLHVGRSLAVENAGRVWGAREVAAMEVRETEGVGQKVGESVDENIRNGSMGLARE